MQYPPLPDVAAAAGWLEGLINLERRSSWSYERLDLTPIESLLDALGHPERGLSVVHIAGSKGKGSTALLVEAILQACGRRVGTFTSPHLERWTERFRIDGQEVSGQRLVDAVTRVRPDVERLRQDPARVPSFFDATTAVAWCLFEDARVDHAVMEVGLGGRLDSTNAVEPALTCITSIELEHTDKLGDTLAAIASEKAGILKPGVPAVVGALPPEAMKVVEARARELDAPLVRLGREILFEVSKDPDREPTLTVRDGDLLIDTRFPLLGSHQAGNAALAVACAKRVLAGVAEGEVKRGAALALAHAELPGRIEVLREAPRVLVDSAHTVASAHSLADVLRKEPGDVHLVLSISADKHVATLLEILLEVASRVTFTEADRNRSMPAEALADLARERVGERLVVLVDPDPESALRDAHARLPADAVLCAAGSVYLAGIARRVLGSE
jgi:dihydrofolate synthase/folylpolyglutamate synthase